MLSLFEVMQRVSVRLMLHYTVLPPQKRLILQSFNFVNQLVNFNQLTLLSKVITFSVLTIGEAFFLQMIVSERVFLKSLIHVKTC